MKAPVRVAVTGAAGQIGYALLFRIAAGDMLGPDQPVILHLLEITPALSTLQGVVMELNDCAFPTLAGVVGRHAGSVPGFHYSAGFAHADWTWDAAHLDRWITNPQAMIPGAVMPYHQANPKIRAAIVHYLTEQAH